MCLNDVDHTVFTIYIISTFQDTIDTYKFTFKKENPPPPEFSTRRGVVRKGFNGTQLKHLNMGKCIAFTPLNYNRY